MRPWASIWYRSGNGDMVGSLPTATMSDLVILAVCGALSSSCSRTSGFSRTACFPTFTIVVWMASLNVCIMLISFWSLFQSVQICSWLNTACVAIASAAAFPLQHQISSSVCNLSKSWWLTTFAITSIWLLRRRAKSIRGCHKSASFWFGFMWQSFATNFANLLKTRSLSMAKETPFLVLIANSHADIRATISARTAVWTIPGNTPLDNGWMFWLDNVPTATPHEANLLMGLVGARQPPSVNIQIGSFPAWKGSCSTVLMSSADSSFWKLLSDGGSGIHPWTHTAKSRPLISWICSSVRCSLHLWKVLHSQWRCSWLSGSPQCLQF